MIKLKLVIFLLSINLFCFSQHQIKGDWKSKAGVSDTLVLIKDKGFDYSEYLSHQEEYTDTTYYWHFNEDDSLRLEVVIRSNRYVPAKGVEATHGIFTVDSASETKNIQSLPGSKKEARQIKKMLKNEGVTSGGREKNKKHGKEKDTSELTTYEEVYLSDSTQIRLSLWYPHTGLWRQEQNVLHITNLQFFSDSYIVVPVNSEKLLLIRIKE